MARERERGPTREGARRAGSGGGGGGGVETSPNGRLSYTSTKCWEAWTPTACAVPVKYVPLSNRFSFEAKLVEHSEVEQPTEQAACTT